MDNHISIDEQELQAKVDEILNRHPAVGLAVGVVRNGRLDLFHGHGVADISSHTPITENTVFRIGSITKTFTAIAVMQLWEQGAIDLDAPANDYLRAYKLIPAKGTHRSATLRHLLTYTAGLPECVYLLRAFKPTLGEMVKFGRPVPTLAQFYRGGPRLVAEPGTMHIYSNHAFAALGQIVEDVSGKPLQSCFREHIFEPLGMEQTDLVRSDRVRHLLATGYALRSHGPHAVGDYDLITAGGGGIYSTTRDMARYVAALLGGGANDHGTILKPETLATMFAAQYEPDPRAPGVGLSFYRRDVGGRLVVEKDGLVPGFASQMSVALDDGVGIVAFTNGARGAHEWLGPAVTGILRHVLCVPDDAVRTDVPNHPEVWADLCGWYTFRGSFRDVQKWLIAGVEVFVRRGLLMLRPVTPIPALSHGLALHSDDDKDPYVFKVDLSAFGIGTSRVVFSRKPGAVAPSLHLDLALLSFDRQPAVKDPRPWITGALGLMAAGATATAARRCSRMLAGGETRGDGG